MKFLFPVLLLLIFSCTSKGTNQVYICGDHPCVNKAEMRDYFKNNISIEVYTVTSEKEKKESLGLVQLNLLKEDMKKNEKINKSLSIKKEKKNIEKIINERKKLAKLKIKKNEKKDVNKLKLPAKEAKLMNKKIKKTKETEKTKEKVTFVRLCKNLDECDIDQISKIIMKMGKDKPFPDLTTQ